jgi:hypothetical protein
MDLTRFKEINGCIHAQCPPVKQQFDHYYPLDLTVAERLLTGPGPPGSNPKERNMEYERHEEKEDR